MKINKLTISVSAILIAASAFAAGMEKPHVMAKDPVAAGRYLTVVAGCMDCHTGGWLFMPGKIPESAWLTGWEVGWKGPWGTSYPRNLRVSVAKYSVEDWIKLIKGGTLLSPMPWENLKMTMSDDDFKSIYAYIKSLPMDMKAIPDDLPPGQTPKGPYIDMTPQNMQMPAGGMPPGGK